MKVLTRQKLQRTAIPLLVLTLCPALPASALITTSGKRPIPLEQVISMVRQQHGNMVVYNTRLSEEDRRVVRVVDFKQADQPMQRMVIDAYTGKELELVTMRTPMSLEKVLEKIRRKHQMASITRTWLENREGTKARIIEFVDHRKRRWHTEVDAYTGLLLKEHSFKLKATGKQIPLSQIITDARANHKNMIVLRTSLRHKSDTQVREIVYMDDSHLRKRLVVDALTGRIISDQIVTNPVY